MVQQVPQAPAPDNTLQTDKHHSIASNKVASYGHSDFSTSPNRGDDGDDGDDDQAGDEDDGGVPAEDDVPAGGDGVHLPALDMQKLASQKGLVFPELTISSSTLFVPQVCISRYKSQGWW